MASGLSLVERDVTAVVVAWRRNGRPEVKPSSWTHDLFWAATEPAPGHCLALLWDEARGIYGPWCAVRGKYGGLCGFHDPERRDARLERARTNRERRKSEAEARRGLRLERMTFAERAQLHCFFEVFPDILAPQEEEDPK